MTVDARLVLPETPLLKSSVSRVTRLGLGGEGPVLRSKGRPREAIALIRRALDLGITYFDTARAYADSERYLGIALGGERHHVFLASKTAKRQAAGAARDLDTTLRNLRTDYLDLWQVHDLRRREQWLQVAARGGALQTFDHARSAGKVRMIGVTAHQNPRLLAEVLRAYPFDAVLMPMNVLEAQLPGFSTTVLSVARERRVAVIGMLVMAQGILPRVGLPADLLLRFALGLPAAVLAVGADTPRQLEENVRSAAKGPLRPSDHRRFRRIVAPFAVHLATYRGNDPSLKPADNGSRSTQA